MNFKLVSVLLFSTLLSGCNSKYDSCLIQDDIFNCKTRYKSIQGTFYDDRFYDQKGWYSVQVPKQYQHQMEDFYTSHLSGSVFKDQFGNLMRFEIMKIPDDLLCPEFLENAHHSFGEKFHECTVKVIKKKFPTTTVIHEELKESSGGPFYFAILNIPKGSTCVNAITNEPADSTRGYLLFLSDNELIVLSNQNSPLFDVADKYRDQNTKNEIILGQLLKMRELFRNEIYGDREEN